MRLAASAAKSPVPKGILSPSKKSGTPLKKSVSFHGNASEVFFEDLPRSVSAKKTTRQPKLLKPVDPEPEADEIVCAVCSRPDSEPPNEIILCDNCDFAAHQVCYGVPEIPEGDWLCKACTQDDVLDGSPRKSTRELVGADAPVTAVEELPDIPHLDHHLRSLQRVLLDRCAGRRRLRMLGQDEAYEKAQQLVEQTVNAGEGNSMLLIGPRGCGKTTMLENIVADFSRQHRRDFFVVRLNGFIHTDDKLALKEIWRQLGKEMNVEDDLLNRSNYADTMASLLALLSHPSEISGTDDGVTCQSVIFIIDEFDLFAAHPRQTLLYNLFDIAQSRKAPIAVLGCTTRLDVVEMLEKRVKSRFSHRHVYLSLPRSLPVYWQICRQGLMLGEVEPEDEGLDARVEGHTEFQKYWNGKIQELYNQPAFQELLQIQLLSTLSDLELGLLIAGARLDIVADTDTVNFAMVYDEYSSLVGRQRAQSATSGMLAIGGGARVWSRGVAGIAWERLITLGLLVPAGVGGANSRVNGHGGLDGKMWRIDVALEEIPGAVKLSTVLAKWCKEL
ncbi:Origin recognition complex subunit 4 [Escovopsis weberi]|uniref:Origin recognition complex subunit 4 n=1 Tax=Escovopsis weberi TaxID=150374 RepID=A0A0M8N0W0_ESCWE|nr:Origin recognition complex subunit 4 [Escovopsis weberi]